MQDFFKAKRFDFKTLADGFTEQKKEILLG